MLVSSSLQPNKCLRKATFEGRFIGPYDSRDLQSEIRSPFGLGSEGYDDGGIHAEEGSLGE